MRAQHLHATTHVIVSAIHNVDSTSYLGKPWCVYRSDRPAYNTQLLIHLGLKTHHVLGTRFTAGINWIPRSVQAVFERMGWEAPHVFALLFAVAVPTLLLAAFICSEMCEGCEARQHRRKIDAKTE